ncbi:transglutaminase-like domain-containing protein [Aurantiacibacter spongiae]|uniref:Transglutaminase family protein n=1 Tax=Aurantiacibacter spongiae TaxID=2488860 RepID=A0A3N5CS04_9SPHN|nr:transglutaminase family protein [Aurantiacibacter spongiae]RPF71933.1 transglutaminase family protein [Aurantiacibacter spongiae]
MPIDITAKFDFHLENPTDILLQFEAAAIPEQEIVGCETKLPRAMHTARVPAHNSIGERIWVRAQGDYHVEYTARVDVRRMLTDLCDLDRLDPHDLPGETVEYLFDSRYCQADRMQSFVQDEFGHLAGGEQIVAMRDWIAEHFDYVPGASNATTTALDSFVERRGICRDYAHVMICFARAATIPARFVSCYAPGVEPPDFHAVAEVFLADKTTPGGGAWYIVDPTGMADPDTTAKIGIGRDAADVSFLTSFGLAEFRDKTVSVTRSG